ncbi:ImmA/IrrE family metallo-endopeptidase, partial [Fusicatenibacter saccharivorans]|uniref:ImmA/IrrE family metallo-endopeptidase n=1 Tax=Fusicatenibacter saccharivorans TaxID=1150298 RepID=UPI0034A575D2
MTYEEMQKSHTDLNIVEMDLSEISGLKGLYYAGNIAIEKNLSSTEKSCVLAEELGHHYTTYGNIMDQKDIQNRKQELRARLYGYDMQIGLIGIIECYKHHCRSIYEMAEYLQVTEEYLKEALH